MAADAVGLLDDGVHAQLGDLVDERVLIAFSVLDHCRGTAGAEQVKKSKEAKRRGRPFVFFTQIFPAFVLIDVDVDLLDGLQRLRQLGPVVVVLRRGSEQLHQQQRVAHHSLYRLDEERAQVDVVCLSPGRQTDSSGHRETNWESKVKQLRPLILPQNTYGFSCSLQKCPGGHIIRILASDDVQLVPLQGV